MASLETPVCDFGWKAADFDLPGVDGKRYNLASVKGEKGLLVMFICNHCPYVKAIRDRIVRDVAELRQYGIGAIAIMSNDPADYPEDSFDNMARIARESGFSFPYVWDETQQVAKAYGAACTPTSSALIAARIAVPRPLDASRKEAAPPGARRELFEGMLQVAKPARARNRFPASAVRSSGGRNNRCSTRSLLRSKRSHSRKYCRAI